MRACETVFKTRKMDVYSLYIYKNVHTHTNIYSYYDCVIVMMMMMILVRFSDRDLRKTDIDGERERIGCGVCVWRDSKRNTESCTDHYYY